MLMLGEYNAGWVRSKLGIRILVDRRAAGLGILAGTAALPGWLTRSAYLD